MMISYHCISVKKHIYQNFSDFIILSFAKLIFPVFFFPICQSIIKYFNRWKGNKKRKAHLVHYISPDVSPLINSLCPFSQLDWIGLDWIGLDWIELDWTGLDGWVSAFISVFLHFLNSYIFLRLLIKLMDWGKQTNGIYYQCEFIISFHLLSV